MKAMILAAGEGTRLRPLTLELPKVLLPIAGMPLIQWTLSWLKNHGIEEIAINLFHLGQRISGFLGDGSGFGVKIVYSPEEALLGTAGGVKRMERFFDGTFVVVYGDVLTDFDLGAMIEFHKRRDSWATIALWEFPNPWDVAVVSSDQEGRILELVEKPPRGSKVGNLGSGGIYVLERQVLDYVPSEGHCDFAYDVLPNLIMLGAPVYGYALSSEDYLIDIGTWENYRKANEDAEKGKIKPLGSEAR
jgi:NDP-sugar pyrophosphorylase family protein